MTYVPFRGARAKLERARALTKELENEISSYKGAVLVAHPIPINRLSWRIEKTYEPPILGPLLGDAVHNLRSSLDHLAVSVVHLNGGNTKGVHFPFSGNRADLDRMIKDKKFDRASEEAQNLLRKFKPYRGGDSALRGIHDLDIADKHHDLIPVWADGEQERPVKWTNGQATGRLRLDNEEIYNLPREGYSIPQPIPLRFRVFFHEDNPFAKREIVPTLEFLSDKVASVLEAFSSLYRR